uniref:protein kintoun-like n=1 Tax=Semicossyphus pulcher TaxID=241346 RepID=UPI0037E70869
MEVGDKLKELNMTADEIDRMTQAFKDEKFREMLRDYAEELSDPENKKRYEEEIKLLEQERGNTIEFIHPEPFRALKTSVNGKQKCFINICGNEKVGKPECKAGTSETGRRGQCWSLPYSLHPGKQNKDAKGNKIMIYDVVFHPDTLHIASKNKRFMDMVDSTAIEGIQNTFEVTLDKNNVREMSTKYKGTPQPCVIRKPIPGCKIKEASDTPDRLAFPYPNEKSPSTSSQTKNVDTPKSFQSQPQKTKEPTKPNCTVKYRSFIDLQDFRCSRDSTQSPRPKEIVVTIDVPLLKAVTDANLEVTERNLLLESKKPAYRLELPLAYPVDEDKGEAKFNKKTGQLTVTLPVLPSNEALEFAVGLHKAGVSDGERQEEEKEAEEEDKQEEKERKGQKREEDEKIKVKEDERDTKEEERCKEKGEKQITKGKNNEDEENLQKRIQYGDRGINEHKNISEDVCDKAAGKKDAGVISSQGDQRMDISPEEEENPEAEIQPDLITAENSRCIIKEQGVSLVSTPKIKTPNIKEETEMTEEGNLKVEIEAAFLQHSTSEESQVSATAVSFTPDHSENIKDSCISQRSTESSKMPAKEEPNKTSRESSSNVVTLHSEEVFTGSEKQEEMERADEDDLWTEQIIRNQEHDGNMAQPVLLREVDEDGNEKVISDHSTSAGFIFENSLMFELD